VIRRLNIGNVTEPIYMVRDGRLVQAGATTRYVLVVEESFDDPDEAQAMLARIQQRGTILDEQIEWCSGSGRWPEGVASSGRTGLCPRCRAAWSLDDHGRLMRHLPSTGEESVAPKAPRSSDLLEIL